ncbi:hypothetical protein EV714DRAFT_286833 [Schizophyllum commune]
MRCPTYDPQEVCTIGPPAPRWSDMPTPPRARRILGFLLTPRVTAPFCDEYCPLPDNATSVDVQAHLSHMRSYIPFLMADKHGLAPAPHRAQRKPPARDVVERVADDLGFEGDAREPRWYKPAS